MVFHTAVERTAIDADLGGHVDLLGTIVIATVTALLVAYGVNEWVLMPLLVVLVGFLPGYALIAAAFPATTGEDRPDADQSSDGGVSSLMPDALERLALAVGGSVLMLPLVGVAIGTGPWAFSRLSVVVGLAGTTIVAAAAGVARRIRTMPADRYRPGPVSALRGGRATAAVSLTLALSALVVLGVLAFTIAAPQPGAAFSELYVLGSDGDGAPVAAEYPTSVTTDETMVVHAGVENHERQPEDYTLIVRLESLDENEVVESDRLAERRFTLESGRSWRDELELSPTMAGENLRVSFLLYTEDPGFFVNQRTAYRHTHIWVDVPE